MGGMRGEGSEKTDNQTADRLERGAVERRRTGKHLWNWIELNRGGLFEGQGHMYVCSTSECG